MRYRTVPKFAFRDAQDTEWRIRRRQVLRSPIFRWRVEEKTPDRWVLRAWAPTRKVALERMAKIWARQQAAVGTAG